MADVRLMKYHQNIEGYTVYGKRWTYLRTETV
jgi:hypothetical protein